MQNIIFPWSDNWWIEEDKAWFCANMGALFCVDMLSGQCEIVAWIPECDANSFRLYSYCIKSDDIVFCIAKLAHSIWCYDIKKEAWKKIEVCNANELIMCMHTHKGKNDKIWLLEDRIGTVFQLDLKRQAVVPEYQCARSKNMDFYEYTIVEDSIYNVSERKIFCLNKRAISVYEIEEAKAGLCTICYDGQNFWMSGFCKEIYIWNPKQGMIKVITEFPEQFGYYHFVKDEIPVVDSNSFHSIDFPFFINSIPMNRYIWFIPFCSDEIVYIDKENYEVHLLEIEEERETKESIQNHIMPHKYLVQYIREDRYIGLYSLRNALIFEIDTIELCVIKRNYKLTGTTMLSILETTEGYHSKKVLKEGRKMDDLYFSEVLKTKNSRIGNKVDSFGEMIYHFIELKRYREDI